MLNGDIDKAFSIPGPESVPIQHSESFFPEDNYQQWSSFPNSNYKNHFQTYPNFNPYQYYQSILQSQVQNQFPTPQLSNFQSNFFNPVQDESLNYLNYHHNSHKLFGNKFGHELFQNGIKKLKAKAKKLKGAALSALTLLAFMFFLHILQMCLKEHMDSVNPTV